MGPPHMKEIRYDGRSVWVGWRRRLRTDAGRQTGMLIFDPADQDGTERGRVRLFKVHQQEVACFKTDIVFRPNQWDIGMERLAEMEAAVMEYVRSHRPKSPRPQDNHLLQSPLNPDIFTATSLLGTIEECMGCGQVFQVIEVYDLQDDALQRGPQLAVGRHACETPMERCCAYRSYCSFHRMPGEGRGAEETSVIVVDTRGSPKPDRPVFPWSLLDKAIAAVAAREYRRLSAGLTPSEVANRVDTSVEPLGKYHDEWAALFYLTWYQPRQINLIYSFLRSVLRGSGAAGRVADQRRDPQQGQLFDYGFGGSAGGHPPYLHVFDLGCGARAVQIALALFASEGCSPKTKVFVHGIDTSSPMKDIGLRLWQDFSKRLQNQLVKVQADSPDAKMLRSLQERIVAMSPECRTYDSLAQCLDSLRTSRMVRGDRWLTSIHAAYHLSRDLHQATEALIPDAVLVTADETKAESLDRVLRPIAGEQSARRFVPERVQPAIRGRLVHTTGWRKKLAIRMSREWPEWINSRADRDLNSLVEWDLRRNPIFDDEVRFRGTFR